MQSSWSSGCACCQDLWRSCSRESRWLTWVAGECWAATVQQSPPQSDVVAARVAGSGTLRPMIAHRCHHCAAHPVCSSSGAGCGLCCCRSGKVYGVLILHMVMWLSPDEPLAVLWVARLCRASSFNGVYFGSTSTKTLCRQSVTRRCPAVVAAGLVRCIYVPSTPPPPGAG